MHLTPATRDRALALEWFERFEGAGLDGVVAKRLDAALPARRARDGQGEARAHRRLRGGAASAGTSRARARCVGSLLLGLYDDAGVLHHVGIAASFTMKRRKELVEELAPLRENALDGHPWREWAAFARRRPEPGQRMPGATSRWNRGKDLSWEPLRLERVCEVGYDHLQGDRFRHATHFRPLAPRQAARPTAATTSWKSAPPPSWRSCSAAAGHPEYQTP